MTSSETLIIQFLDCVLLTASTIAGSNCPVSCIERNEMQVKVNNLPLFFGQTRAERRNPMTSDRFAQRSSCCITNPSVKQALSARESS